MYNKQNFKTMSVVELEKARKMRLEIIKLNKITGVQSDSERNFLEDETKRFEKELIEINKLLKEFQTPN